MSFQSNAQNENPFSHVGVVFENKRDSAGGGGGRKGRKRREVKLCCRVDKKVLKNCSLPKEARGERQRQKT